MAQWAGDGVVGVMASCKRCAEGGGGMGTVLLFVAAVVAFLLVVRLAGKARCLGWVIGLACLIGFLYVVSVLW